MEDTPAVTAEELNQVLSASAFAGIYQLRLQAIASGKCTLIAPFQESLERPGGIVAGAVLMTVADVAMWLAIMTRLGTEAMLVTTEIKTTFLSSARREDVLCTATVLKLGRQLIYGVAECRNQADKLLTHHTLTYLRLDR